ncbi:BadF/BadG/BcrA/BcrD ATPase family protein [Actinacidiphila oryziradicis]|uniref:ATPase n=1 Tax=Actinacidiphila oryziradicis TaxID=2571141 RepID=A0A4V5N0H9_9ACTN|nr:BadF/BadG/BcrA/BcrD ATPase family protein [Actinacidiphila oryziradicis]TKA12129.1 ATPase [Actinacidiphila oryziradicis]
MQDRTTLVVGIDVGGTKTHLRARAGDDTVADLVRTSRGWQPHDPQGAANWLTDLIHEALPEDARPHAVAVGGRDCETPRQSELIRQALGQRLGALCRVVNDAELLVPALGLAEGVGLVAGTGAVAVGHTAAGELVQVGGWGAVLGDEGSSAGLVREAIRAVYAAHDRAEAPDELTRLLLAALGVPEVPALGAALEAADDVAAGWGRHASAVFEAAAAGSRAAQDVIAAGGRALTGLVVRLAERGATVDDVVVAGGTVLNQPVLYGALTDALASSLPGTRVHPLQVPPVAGAVALALALAPATA